MNRINMKCLQAILTWANIICRDNHFFRQYTTNLVPPHCNMWKALSTHGRIRYRILIDLLWYEQALHREAFSQQCWWSGPQCRHGIFLIFSIAHDQNSSIIRCDLSGNREKTIRFQCRVHVFQYFNHVFRAMYCYLADLFHIIPYGEQGNDCISKIFEYIYPSWLVITKLISCANTCIMRANCLTDSWRLILLEPSTSA